MSDTSITSLIEHVNNLTEPTLVQNDKGETTVVYKPKENPLHDLINSYNTTTNNEETTTTEDNANAIIEEEDATNNLADLVSSNQSDNKVGMENFSKVLNKLNDKFCNGRAVYTMYFKMNLTAGGVLVDTTSEDWLENNLLSFTHKMNGSGEANTFTLDILFKPDDRNFKSIAALEQKLLTACAVYANEVSLKPEKEIYSNCNFQYGYGDDISLRSPTYYGTIMDYDCKIENGNLRYTITGYCGLYSAKEYRISAISDYLTDKNGNEITDPISYICRIIEIEFGKDNLYDYKIVNIPDKNDVKCPNMDYKKFNQKNIFQVIRDILSACMTNKQYEAMEAAMHKNSTSLAGVMTPNQKQIFGYYISDKPSENGAKYGTIYIYKMESLYGDENKGLTEETIQPDCGITFSWFAPTSGAFNHIVKDWHPQYEGSIMIALATTLLKGGNEYYTVTDAGNIRKVKSLGAARPGINNDTEELLSTIQEYNNWAFVTQYSYKANMTIMGAPCEVPMTGKIKVIAKMGNENHHSSGVYMVLGKTDKISSSGFFTELELFKFTMGYNPIYTEEAIRKNPINAGKGPIYIPEDSTPEPEYDNPYVPDDIEDAITPDLDILKNPYP